MLIKVYFHLGETRSSGNDSNNCDGDNSDIDLRGVYDDVGVEHIDCGNDNGIDAPDINYIYK